VTIQNSTVSEITNTRHVSPSTAFLEINSAFLKEQKNTRLLRS